MSKESSELSCIAPVSSSSVLCMQVLVHVELTFSGYACMYDFFYTNLVIINMTLSAKSLIIIQTPLANTGCQHTSWNDLYENCMFATQTVRHTSASASEHIRFLWFLNLFKFGNLKHIVCSNFHYPRKRMSASTDSSRHCCRGGTIGMLIYERTVVNDCCMVIVRTLSHFKHFFCRAKVASAWNKLELWKLLHTIHF